jgi:hypothetical protein
MDIEGSRKFITKHSQQIINLFLTYQMIEIILFMKLHFPELPQVEDRDDALEVMNKELNSKTLGKLKNKYLKRFPKDDYDLKLDLETVATQRNSFMHSFWMIIALGQDRKKIEGIGEILLNDFDKQAAKLLNKIYGLPA